MQESTVLGSTHIRRHHFPETSQELGREGGVVKPAHFRDFYAQERVVGERKWEHARERESVCGGTRGRSQMDSEREIVQVV